MGLEVGKEKSSPYVSGRETSHWLNIPLSKDSNLSAFIDHNGDISRGHLGSAFLFKPLDQKSGDRGIQRFRRPLRLQSGANPSVDNLDHLPARLVINSHTS
jgi:hypothetical protein